MEAAMVANKLAQLSDAELALMEKILHREILKEADQNKTWKNKNQYERPFAKSNALIKCLSAIQAQRDLNRKMEVRW